MSLTAPSNEVDICNLASIKLKGENVANINEPTTDLEQLFNNYYQQVRRATLRAHPWNFASRRAQLPSSTDVPEFGFSHAFDLPDGFVRLKGVYGDDGAFLFNPEGYDVEDGQILFNGEGTTALNIKYIYDHTQIAKWDPLAIRLFVVNLAIELAPKLSNGANSKIASLEKSKMTIMAEATAIDGQERPPIRVQRSKFLRARRLRSRFASGTTDTGA